MNIRFLMHVLLAHFWGMVYWFKPGNGPMLLIVVSIILGIMQLKINS